MGTQISPMLAVSNGNAAIDFYKAAFGTTLLWHLGQWGRRRRSCRSTQAGFSGRSD
jgi:uncharacterized glyoxalase superfamily protein PhnB